MKRTVCCVGVGGWYPRGVDRLHDSLEKYHPDGPVDTHVLWNTVLPTGSPTHQEAPYAFKFYALEAARQLGADMVLWLDASMWVVRDLQPLWDEIEEHGTTFFRSGWALGSWASDASLKALRLSREDALTNKAKNNLVAGGIFGLDLRQSHGMEFLRAMMEFVTHQPEIFRGAWDNKRSQVSDDPRCLGHRHDMVPMSYLVNTMGLHVVNPPKFWALPTEEHPCHPDAVILARGM